tara:strand:- start:382 stop:849 length:468 start_codon:yes stop_codon:yes gene_type:complete
MSNDIKIAEKVKFWEEQKKINEALIPRVLELSNILETQSKTIKDYSDSLVKIEERLHSRLNKELDTNKEILKEINDSISKNSALINEINESYNNHKKEIDDSISKNSSLISKIEQKLNTQLDNMEISNRKNIFIISTVFGTCILLLLILIISGVL